MLDNIFLKLYLDHGLIVIVTICRGYADEISVLLKMVNFMLQGSSIF